MKITAQDLMDMDVADRIIKEPIGGAHRNYDETAEILKDVILEELQSLEELETADLINQRIEKLSKIGAWEE
ncbi:MAG: hypothetical protein GF372_05280 [Candidatus Marinimicrobia bacterium]|nr:hypothetical protein [Candidatus Neomarinimicrobiota bacterium]